MLVKIEDFSKFKKKVKIIKEKNLFILVVL